MIRKNFIIAALLVVLTLCVSGGMSYASVLGTWGDGTRYDQLQEKAVFYNNSGSAMTSGMIVILDTSGTAGSTLGSYITTTTSTDSAYIVGVTDNYGTGSYATAGAVVVITKGPAKVLVDDLNDAVAAGTVVGTHGTAGYGGAHTDNAPCVGLCLEAGSGGDGEFVWMWVDPSRQ